MFKPVKVPPLRAEVAELADALASGASGRKVVEVQILSSAPAFAHRLCQGCRAEARSAKADLDLAFVLLLLSTIHQPISTSGDRGIAALVRARSSSARPSQRLDETF